MHPRDITQFRKTKEESVDERKKPGHRGEQEYAVDQFPQLFRIVELELYQKKSSNQPKKIGASWYWPTKYYQHILDNAWKPQMKNLNIGQKKTQTS